MPRTILPAIFILLVVLAGLSACKVSVKPDFDSSFPQDRFAAIAQARKANDTTAIEPLIGQLSSDDPLVRLAAIDTLRNLTGLDHGYDHAADREDRRLATKRWMQWFATSTYAAGTAEGEATR